MASNELEVSPIYFCVEENGFLGIILPLSKPLEGKPSTFSQKSITWLMQTLRGEGNQRPLYDWLRCLV